MPGDPPASDSRRLSRRDLIRTSALALPLVAASRAGWGPARTGAKASPGDFVRVRDGRFELRGKPYFYVGANLWYGCYLGDAALPGGRARLARELDRLRGIGVDNVRLLAGSETSPLVGAIPRGITRAPRDWDEALLRGLDFCLDEMAKRDMRAVLFLSNYWQWSGSFAQYVRWVTGEPIPDPDLPRQAAGDWTAFMQFSARLYTTPAANELYRAYAAHLIDRRNTVNGRLYRADPTIMTWELANEPRPGPETEETRRHLPAFCRWVDDTARFIHALAPDQLVCTGTEGTWGCLQDDDLFVKAHRSPAVDYTNVHLWLKNWSWLKDPCLSPDYEAAAARGLAHVERHIRLATDVLHKPLTLEEFGLPRDHERYAPEDPTTARDDFFARMFNQLFESCRAGRALQGANFWAWAGEGRVNRESPESAAAFTGDPFCEPQGLNSVFDTDRSTQRVIAEANERLRSLAR